METSAVLDRLFADVAPATEEENADVRRFLVGHGPPPDDPSEPEDPFARLLRVAMRADRRSTASAAGHQAAIRRLFPATPAAAVAAFCVSEAKGPHPAHIHSSLTEDGERWRLDGTKNWASLAPLSDVLYVAASIGRQDERNLLRMVTLPTGRPGLTIDTAPYLERYGADAQLADLTFDGIAIEEHEILPEDGYLHYIKPFRLVEDVHITAAIEVALLRHGLRVGWPDEWLDRLVGRVTTAASVASTAMASSAEVVLLTSYLRAAAAGWTELWAVWEDWVGDPETAAVERRRWAPERGLLGVAAKARESRRAGAWADLR